MPTLVAMTTSLRRLRRAFSEDDFGFATGTIHIGGIEQIDTGIERLAYDLTARLLFTLAMTARPLPVCVNVMDPIARRDTNRPVLPSITYCIVLLPRSALSAP
jgi:hypothetical protein